MPGCREGCGLDGKLAAASSVKPFKPSITPGNQIWFICVWPAAPWETCKLRPVLGQLFPGCLRWDVEVRPGKERNSSSGEMAAPQCVSLHQVPASALEQGGPRGCPGVFCPSLVRQPPGNPLRRGGLWGELWVKKEAVSGWEKWADKASPSTCQSIKLNTQTGGQPWKPSTIIYTNTVIFPQCCLREAGLRCYLLNNYPTSQGQSSLQLLHREPGGHLWWFLRAVLCHWQLTEHIEMAAPHAPTSKEDNCIKGCLFFFFSISLLGEIE